MEANWHQEEIGPLTDVERRLVAALELTGIERLVPAPLRGAVGNPERDRRPLARAFAAKAALNLPTTRALIDRLESSPSLRRLCGWERRGELPDESAFSYRFAFKYISIKPRQTRGVSLIPFT